MESVGSFDWFDKTIILLTGLDLIHFQLFYFLFYTQVFPSIHYEIKH